MSAMDVVYICRAGENNEELRHSLRSVAANLPHRNVWIVGYRPRWVTSVQYLPTMQRGPKHANTWAGWVAAARCADISDEFVLFNDDFFVTRPIEDVPAVHRGPLDEMMSWYAQHRLPSHRQRAAVTRQALQRAGHAALWSYELHVPMVVNRHTLAAGIAWLASGGATAGHNIAKRTFYGNLADAGGERVRDVKVMRTNDGLPDGSALPFVSTSPASWAGLAGGWVRQLFPDPCRYERVPSERMYQPPGRNAAHAGRR